MWGGVWEVGGGGGEGGGGCLEGGLLGKWFGRGLEFYEGGMGGWRGGGGLFVRVGVGFCEWYMGVMDFKGGKEKGG